MAPTFRQLAYFGAGLAGGLGKRQEVQSPITGAVFPLIAVLVADGGGGSSVKLAAAALVTSDGDLDVADSRSVHGPAARALRFFRRFRALCDRLCHFLLL